MEEIYTGPYCETLKLTCRNLFEKNISVQCDALQNGVVVELVKLFKRDINSVVTIIQTLCSALKEINPLVLKTKISRLAKTKDRFRQKKKVPGFKNLKDFLDANFHVTRRMLKPQLQKSQDHEGSSSSDPRGIEATVSAGDTDHEISDSIHGEREFQKRENLLQYEISKKSKKLCQVLNNISYAETKLEDLERRIGQYSLKNVKKRDEYYREKLQILNKRIRMQNVNISKLSTKHILQQQKLKQLQLDNKYLKECTDKKSSIDEEIRKKRAAQKLVSHFRLQCTKMQKSTDEHIQAMDMKLKEKEIRIQTLEIENENLSSETIKTKEEDGTFTDNLRMCIIELSGLEVATQKVSPVIMCISKHLFGKILKKDDLPSTPTVQAIVDQGHFLAKRFISEQLVASENWGVNRDGTTRKKQKIIDTSISLPSGRIISLGFTRVGSETANAIHNVTKEHLMELANIHGSGEAKDSDEFIKSTLKKLAFCMSDRASNQKKANELLSEWRDDMIKDFAGQDTSPVLNFYCMAHVLLGFHTYCCKDIREYEKTLVSKHGRLGRDTLSFFSNWKSESSIMERVVRTVSEIFGPAGDHYGIRDLWELPLMIECVTFKKCEIFTSKFIIHGLW